MHISTNKVPRPIIEAWELSESERADFDYLDWPAIEEGRDSASFFRYRGTLYDLGQFATTRSPWGVVSGTFKEWDVYMDESAFSVFLVRYIDNDSVLVGYGTC